MPASTVGALTVVEPAVVEPGEITELVPAVVELVETTGVGKCLSKAA